MNWNRGTDNQPTVLASATVARNGFCACFKPSLATIGGDATYPMRGVFAGQIFAHKQPVTGFAAKQRLSVLLSDFPRFALKGRLALPTDKRSRLNPSQIFVAAHVVRSKSIGWSLSCAKRITELVIVRSGAFSKNKLGLTASRAKARFIVPMKRLLIFAATLCALICNAVSFSESPAGTAAKLRIRGFRGDSAKGLIALLAGKFDFHSRIIPQFMGSGTTLRAAKDLGLKSIGIEIERKYCDIAIERLRQQAFTFQEAA